MNYLIDKQINDVIKPEMELTEAKSVEEEKLIHAKIERLKLIKDNINKKIFTLYQLLGIFEFITNDDDINKILIDICNYYKTNVSIFISKYRGEDLPKKRFVAMVLMKELTLLSLREIGKALGGIRHCSVLYGIEKFKTLHWQKGLEWMEWDYNELKTILVNKYIINKQHHESNN